MSIYLYKLRISAQQFETMTNVKGFQISKIIMKIREHVEQSYMEIERFELHVTCNTIYKIT